MEISFKERLVRLERGGAAFYRRVGLRLREERLKGVLEFLADEEEAHARRMEGLKPVGGDEEILNGPFSRAGEELLRASENREDFSLLAMSFDSVEKILRFALKMEEESIECYTGLLEKVTDPALADQIRHVVAQEHEHRDTIIDLLRLEGGSGEDPFLTPDEMESTLTNAVREDHEKRDQNGE